MLAQAIAPALGLLRRLALWAAYGAFVAIVTSTWITARPASAEVPPGAALGNPVPAGDEGDHEAGSPDGKAGGARGGEPLKVGGSPGSHETGPVFGPPVPEGFEEAHEREARPARDGLRGRLNLNNATAEQLVLLPGIGDAISARVIAWRERNGRFHRVVDLRRVRGIGPKTLERLRPHLTVMGPTTLERAE